MDKKESSGNQQNAEKNNPNHENSNRCNEGFKFFRKRRAPLKGSFTAPQSSFEYKPPQIPPAKRGQLLDIIDYIEFCRIRYILYKTC